MSMRVCAQPGCPTIFDAGEGTRCTIHRKQTDRARGTATERGYNSPGHQAFRRAVLHRDPVCVLCVQRQATVADHHPLSRKQLIDRGLNPDDPKHGRGLCAACHNQQTARNQPGGWHNTV